MRKDIPVSARHPVIRAVAMKGKVLNRPPIFRMSCSLFRLWIMDPEHMNSMALKKACVQICKNARWGWLIPIFTIIRPNWLEVEKAIIVFNVVLEDSAYSCE